MKFWKHLVLWYVGGMGYVALELLWRGWSHGSMFVVGGICFLLIGAIRPLRIPLLMRTVLGACAVTAVELLSGLILNVALGLRIWDYGALPWNLLGQICLPYFFLWNLVSLGAMGADRGLRYALFRGIKTPREGNPGEPVVILRSPPAALPQRLSYRYKY